MVPAPDGSTEPSVPDGDEQEEPDAEAEPGPCPDNPIAGQALPGDWLGGSMLAVLGCRPSLGVPLSLSRATNRGGELHQQ